MKIIEYLKDNRNLSKGEILHELFVKYAIKSVQSKKYPELYLFKYTINSPMNEIICQECRGLILNIDTFQIVSHPYHKFFNYTDPLAHKIDWNTAKCYEKLDGSIMIMYFYKGEWNVSTSGMPDGDGLISDITNQTFAEKFWQLWKELDYKLTSEFLNTYTLMFEMITRENKIVCDYDTEKIVLHGIKHNLTGNEISISNDAPFNWEIVQSHKLQNINDIIKFVNNRTAINHEGIVVCDANFNRIKIKSEEYFNLHHIKSGLNCMRNIVELVRSNKSVETIGMFPEYGEEIRSIEIEYVKLCNEVAFKYSEIKHIESQKDFALYACKYRFNSVLFAMRKNKKSLADSFLKTMSIKNLMKLLNIKSFS